MEKEVVFVNKNEQAIAQETLKNIKDSLLVQKKRVLEELNNISKIDSHEADNRGAQFPEYGDKPDENAQEISDFSTTVATQNILEKSLNDIEKALERIEKGTYGICKYCHNSINEKRLVARPTAGACMTCKTELQENE
ncbi:MAG TPA: TraR/DksA family transcriptional regulator [Patescibacteria group bacterium]|nr:TraR/DksA family transcriptional regulator [Patescibacteria group bacterium]